MTTTCTVLIAPSELIPLIKAQGGWSGEVLGFSDTDPLRALEVILKRQPETVALERGFATSPRGVALINRLKADPTLSSSKIIVISPDQGKQGQSGARQSPATSVAPVKERPRSLDWRGTRAAQRFKMRPDVEMSIDGKPATMVDLSTLGTMVVLAPVLRPGQRVRVMIIDHDRVHRLAGSVVWSSFEMSPERVPRYRAGICFQGADSAWLDDFCARNRAK